jgi:hypothetical protein
MSSPRLSGRSHLRRACNSTILRRKREERRSSALLIPYEHKRGRSTGPRSMLLVGGTSHRCHGLLLRVQDQEIASADIYNRKAVSLCVQIGPRYVPRPTAPNRLRRSLAAQCDARAVTELRHAIVDCGQPLL